MVYRVGNKEIDITHNESTKKFVFTINRAFKAFVFLVENYPNWVSVHDLPDYDDPNRAFGDLFQDEGYDSFVEKRMDGVYHYKISIDKLFDFYQNHTKIEEQGIRRRLLPKELRDVIDKRHGNKCNFMGQTLVSKEEANDFMKKLYIKAYDHRVPLAKWILMEYEGDPNTLDNYQLISEYANAEKNKVCKTCKEDCYGCALSFPEVFDIVKATGQSTRDLFRDEELEE